MEEAPHTLLSTAGVPSQPGCAQPPNNHLQSSEAESSTRPGGSNFRPGTLTLDDTQRPPTPDNRTVNSGVRTTAHCDQLASLGVTTQAVVTVSNTDLLDIPKIQPTKS